MPAYVIYTESYAHPASASPYWLTCVLRDELHFGGLVFSDDLSLEGAALAGNYADRAQASLNAGCDMVLICNHRTAAMQILDRLPPAEVTPISRLYHQGGLSHQQLKATQRWKTANEQLTRQYHRWLAACPSGA